MNLNVPQVDWLTFTSWDEGVYIGWKQWQRLQKGEIRAGRIPRYEGAWLGSIFVGEGIQCESKHALVRVSGEDSHRAFSELVECGEFKCTRLDVQITTELPAGYSARQLVDDLRAGQSGEYRRSVRMIENDDGTDTVYIGSRDSDRFARLYVKVIDGEKYLRFEVEHKSSWAEIVSKTYIEQKDCLASVLMDFLTSIGVDDSQGVLRGLEKILDAVKAGLLLPSVIRDDDKTMGWIMNQVTPAIIRLLADHDKGPYLANHLLDLVDKHFKGVI